MCRHPAFLFGLTACLVAQAPIVSTPPADPFAQLAAMPAAPPVAHGLEVVVVDAAGKPLPAGLLVGIDSGSADYTETRRAAETNYPGDEPRILAARALRGTRYALDDQGVTRVPVDMTGRLIAVHDGLVASVVRSQPKDGARRKRVELRLLPPTKTRVTVLTAEGKPAADMPLRVLDEPTAQPFPDGCTGADGTIELTLLPRPATAFVECVAPLTSRPSGKLVDAGPEGLVLRLPACGQLLATFAGELIPGARIDWRLLDDAGNQVAAATGDRAIAFGWVEAGFRGKLRCLVGRQTFGEAVVPPIVAGEQTGVEVPRDPALRSFAVQLLGPDGAPAANMQVSAQWQHDSGSSSDWDDTNPEGFLELAIPDGVDTDVKLLVDVRSGRWNGALKGWAEIDIGKIAVTRTVHGQVRLLAPEQALRGSVVDTAGKPVAGVQLSTSARSWHAVTTGSDGVFDLTLPGPVPDLIGLHLDSDSWFLADPTTSLEFAKDNRDARIVVRPAARVRAGVRDLPAGLRSDFDCEVHPVEGGPPIRVNWGFSGDEFRVPAGHWHFVVKLGDQEVHRLEDLRADAGVETHDPRFMDFDWRAFAALVTVRVEDKDGRPEDNCTVWHHYRNYGSGSPPTAGCIHILVDKDGGRISVEPDEQGHATVELGLVTGEHTVRIGGGPQLVVELSKVPTLPAGAVLTLRVGEGHEGVAFDAEGRARVLLPKAGSFELHLGVRTGTHTNLVSWSRTVEVGATGDTVKIELTPALQKQIDDGR
ncbi:MAG: hypothetical protein IPK26_05105 [Planctomycetes bacterium]|nr:hypothetical protein [Planctomycetota bacterium]